MSRHHRHCRGLFMRSLLGVFVFAVTLQAAPVPVPTDGAARSVGWSALLALPPLGATSARAQTIPEEIGDAELLRLIADHRGKVVVVNFFATWCGPCLLEIPDLKDLREHYAEDDVFILGLSVDDMPRVLGPFMERQQFNYPVYLAKPVISEMFRVQGIPLTMIYSPKGPLELRHEGLILGEELREIIDELQAQQE